MWITLLAMAVAVSLEPFRIAMTVLMINRPRPALQLLAFLTGGFAMGTAVGMVVLFGLRPTLGSAHFSLPKMQIIVGAIVLLNAALVAVGVLGRPRRRGVSAGWVGRRFAPISARAKQLRDGRSLWAAAALGLGIALPSIDFVAALALIVASGATAATQLGALIAFNVVAFALVEVPLLCYLVAPERTKATLSALYDWVRAQGRRGVSVLLTVVGCVLLGVGFATL